MTATARAASRAPRRDGTGGDRGRTALEVRRDGARARRCGPRVEARRRARGGSGETRRLKIFSVNDGERRTAPRRGGETRRFVRIHPVRASRRVDRDVFD